MKIAVSLALCALLLLGLVLLGEGHGDSMCDKHLAMCKKKPCVDNGKEYCFDKVEMGHCAFMKKICALSEDECEEGKWKDGCEEEDHDDHDGHDYH